MKATVPPIDERDLGFLDEMRGADPLHLVIKSAIYVEHELIELCRLALPQPEALDGARFQLGQRIALAVALGLTTELRGPLKMVAKIRNEFAHDLTSSITHRMATDLYSSFSPDSQASILKTFERVRSEQAEPANHPSTFFEYEPMDRFKICVINVRQALRAAQIHAVRHHQEIARLRKSEQKPRQ
jgi:hypothetical protein